MVAEILILLQRNNIAVLIQMRSRDRIGLLVGAVVVRCFVLWKGSSEWLGERVEISTPVNQWQRGEERL